MIYPNVNISLFLFDFWVRNFLNFLLSLGSYWIRRAYVREGERAVTHNLRKKVGKAKSQVFLRKSSCQICCEVRISLSLSLFPSSVSCPKTRRKNRNKGKMGGGKRPKRKTLPQAMGGGEVGGGG